MRRALFAVALLGATALGGTAFAQSPLQLNEPLVGKEAGTLMLRARAIGVIPLDSSSSISVIRGHVDATAQAAPELDLSYFLSDNIAFELIAATTRHRVSGQGTAIGNVDVGSVWALPPTLTVQYHFMPHAAFSPYVGAGINATIFYGSDAARPSVTHVNYDNSFGPAVQIGADYNLTGHWFANIDAKQIFLSTTAHLSTGLGPVTAKTALNPLVIGMGLGYRF